MENKRHVFEEGTEVKLRFMVDHWSDCVSAYSCFQKSCPLLKLVSLFLLVTWHRQDTVIAWSPTSANEWPPRKKTLRRMELSYISRWLCARKEHSRTRGGQDFWKQLYCFRLSSPPSPPTIQKTVSVCLACIIIFSSCHLPCKVIKSGMIMKAASFGKPQIHVRCL